MNNSFHAARRVVRAGQVAGLCLLALTAAAQPPPAGAPSPAVPAAPAAGRQAIANRRAAFTLIGSSFRPIGQALRQGGAPATADLDKYAARVLLLSDFLPEDFPEASSTGDTRARPQVWSNRADFDRRLKEFHEHAGQLAQILSRHGSSAAFNAAAGAVAQDCKSCHDRYRSE